MTSASFLLTLALLAGRSSPTQDHAERAAPFTAIRFPGETVEIEVESQWWEWVAVDDVAVTDLVEYCKERWPAVWQKRVGEDLVEALVAMGHAPNGAVDLEVRDLESGESEVLYDVPMTLANRQSVLLHGREAVARTRTDRLLSAAEVAEDLARLRWLVDHTYSYAEVSGVDVERAFLVLRESLPDPCRVDQLGIGLLEFLARFGDGHTRLANSAEVLPQGYLPFRIVAHEDRWLAIDPSERNLLDPSHPFVASLDGVEIERWVDAVQGLVPSGSPQLVQHQTEERIAFVRYARSKLGVQDSERVAVVLCDEAGDVVERMLPLGSRPIGAPGRPEFVSAALEREGHSIGILGIGSMDSGERFQERLRAAMEEQRERDALILDVRGNGGGSREALNVLLPYFLAPKEALVVNVAAYRVGEDDDPNDPEGFLANRSLYPEKWSGWNSTEKKAIRAVARRFRPEFELPKKKFSAWHFHVVSTERAAPPFHFEGPVALLSDEGCFSATDIFLGAFELLPQVTVLGSPSAGGSGRTRTSPLPQSGLEVRFSSMVSFRPDGRAYDRRGVEVDVELRPTLDDRLGRRDTVLERSIEHLCEALSH